MGPSMGHPWASVAPYTPITRPRSAGGASSCTTVCPIDMDARFATPPTTSSAIAKRRLPVKAKKTVVMPKIAVLTTVAVTVGRIRSVASSRKPPITPPAPLANSSTLYAIPAEPAPRSCAKIGIEVCSDAPMKNELSPASRSMLTRTWFDRTSRSTRSESTTPTRVRGTPWSRICPVNLVRNRNSVSGR